MTKRKDKQIEQDPFGDIKWGRYPWARWTTVDGNNSRLYWQLCPTIAVQPVDDEYTDYAEDWACNALGGMWCEESLDDNNWADDDEANEQWVERGKHDWRNSLRARPK